MGGCDHDQGRDGFDCHTVSRRLVVSLARAEVQPPNQTDQRAGRAAHDQVQEQIPSSLLTLELQLPGNESNHNYWNRRQRGHKQL